jgi:hypothetical protein
MKSAQLFILQHNPKKEVSMKAIKPLFLATTMAAVFLIASGGLQAAPGAHDIPRAASTPDTPKNWVAPEYKMFAQTLVDELMAGHPEIMSITMHASPPGAEPGTYTMFAGSFSDRIGNMSSPGDIISIVKGVTQVESKWGSANWKKKVSIVLPLKDSTGTYMDAAMVIAFKTSPEDTRLDTDFMAPGIAIRDGLNNRIANFEALFAPAGD